MNDPIQVASGLQAENGSMMEFTLHDIGASFHNDYTVADLQTAAAVLLDLADAIASRLAQLTN